MDATPPSFEATQDADIAVVALTARPAARGKRAGRRAPASRERAGPAGRRRDATAKTGAATRSPRRAAEPIAPQLYLHRLAARSELGRTGVVAVDTPVGRLAVGVAKGRPFAVSDTCRHLFASLGEGRVTREGCLQCPWHRSRYDVTTGHMVRGPQGLLFLTLREIVRTYTNLLFPLHVHPVVERDGVLYLDTAG